MILPWVAWCACLRDKAGCTLCEQQARGSSLLGCSQIWLSESVLQRQSVQTQHWFKIVLRKSTVALTIYAATRVDLQVTAQSARALAMARSTAHASKACLSSAWRNPAL